MANKGIIYGKDIRDKSIPNEKLRDTYTIYGDLTSEPLILTLQDLNIVLQWEYVTATTARLGIRTITGNDTIAINRFTKYDTSSYEGNAQDAYSITETLDYLIDNLIYTNSNDVSQIELAKGEAWYHIKYFISNGGTNARIRITKQY